ncbi:hypothetical protein THAOC_18809, partial [Thalassiosira oceanica]
MDDVFHVTPEEPGERRRSRTGIVGEDPVDDREYRPPAAVGVRRVLAELERVELDPEQLDRLA